jgi:hypothetical protein
MLLSVALPVPPRASVNFNPAGGKPLVVSDPAGAVGSAFMELGATVVREVAKLSAASKYGVTWDEQQQLFRAVLPPAAGSKPEEAFFLEPALVRRNDTSARSINEWTGEALGAADVPAGIKPLGVAPMGNYAVQIQWEDGFSQVRMLERECFCCRVCCTWVATTVLYMLCAVLCHSAV